MKESIKTLIKKYNEDDREFLPEGQGGTEYEKFLNLIGDIHSGEFFERIPVEDRRKRLKSFYKEDEIKQLNEELVSMKQMYKENAPSVIDILKMDIPIAQKQKLLEKMHHLANSEILTGEYNASLKYLLTNINKTRDHEMFKLEQDIIKSAQADEYSDDYRQKILKSKMSFENKVIAYKRLEVMERYEESDSSEYAKYKNWMDLLLSVPFGNYIKTPSLEDMSREDISIFIKKVRETLDQRLSFLENPKDQVLNVVAQMIRNPQSRVNAIGLYGIKGTGKSSIVKSIAEALGRPYRVISLGGESDASVLSGHGFTYVGSSPGRIIEMLIESKCMNPIVLVDELDKISQTHHGKELIGNLIHLTDSTTNARYNYDRYFAGIEFDLSQVLFVFTYNDPSKVDRILSDRLFKIKVENYNIKEKLEITNKHLITNILKEYNFSAGDVQFTDEAITYIVESSQADEGMRDIKRKFEIIVSRINTMLLTPESEGIIKLKYKNLHSEYKQLPIRVLKTHVNTLLEDSISNDSDDKGPPPFMYM
jgi:ATP-dependent Lon protease